MMKTISQLTLSILLGLTLACGGTTNEPDSADLASTTGGTETEADTTNTDTSEAGTTQDDTATPEDTSPIPESPDDSTSLDAGLASRFEGTFAYKRSVTTAQEVPMMGRSEIITESWGYTEITFDGESLWYTEYGCHVVSGGDTPVDVEIPDAIARTIVPQAVRLKVWQDGDSTYWERPENVTLIGVRLDDPMEDALPESTDDSRVFDQDGDGNPGVTVKVGGFISGELYVVQRTVNSYAGRLSDDGILTGTIEEYGDQSVMGATNAMLEQDVPNEAINDPALNVIKLVNVADGIDCDTVVEMADTLF